MLENLQTHITCYRTNCIYNSKYKSDSGKCMSKYATITEEGCMDFSDRNKTKELTHEKSNT